jgi:TATA-box binding protein (TBP) (component of TFIID and TFIIIB)
VPERFFALVFVGLAVSNFVLRFASGKLIIWLDKVKETKTDNVANIFFITNDFKN